MISGLTPLNFRNFITGAAGFLDLDGQSHTILIVKRTKLYVLREAYVEFISADVEVRVMATVNEMQWLDRIELYHTFAFVPATRW